MVRERAGKRAGRAWLGEPIERGAVTLIPVLSRRGSVRGAYVMTGEEARWEPAFNLNRTIMIGNITWLATLAFAWWLIRRRDAARARASGDGSEPEQAAGRRPARSASTW